jgi:3-hydroxybutyrate dehydrogenase
VLEEVILAPQAVRRLIEPDEVAATVAFLLGPDGRAFTDASGVRSRPRSSDSAGRGDP